MIGRLFPEFPITVTMTILVSAFVALTLSPMMCSMFLRDERKAKHGGAHQFVERGFQKLLQQYTRGLDFVLRHPKPTLIVFLITVALSAILYVYMPKGFFPQQDTGIIAGVADASQDISFSEMLRVQHQLTDVVSHDP